MYVEISPRQSGKTYRLVKDMQCKINVIRGQNYHNDLHRHVYLITFRLDWSKSILYMLTKINPVYRPHVTILSSSNHCALMDIPYDANVYYDEFDFIRNPLKGLKIFKNGYYCTTPQEIRPFWKSMTVPNYDMFTNLIKCVGIEHVKSYPMYQRVHEHESEREYYHRMWNMEQHMGKERFGFEIKNNYWNVSLTPKDAQNLFKQYPVQFMKLLTDDKYGQLTNLDQVGIM